MVKREQDETVRELQRFVKARQYYQKGPKPIGDLLSRLMSRKAYAQIQSTDQRAAAWSRVAGAELAANSRAGNVRRGVLDVIARNSIAVQELTFQKKRLVKKMVAELPELKIHDIRFRVGEID